MTITDLESAIANGHRLSRDEALLLYTEAPTYTLGRMADGVRQRKHPEGIVSYIIDRNVNYTNVCVARHRPSVRACRSALRCRATARRLY